jgi:hypothetical protein
MRRRTAMIALSLLASLAATASADPSTSTSTSTSTATATPTPTPTPTPTSTSTSTVGMAVVAFPRATDFAWPLARAVYATPALRPNGLDDAHARILCGESDAHGAGDLHDLADTVAALRGEDAPTRVLLGEIARRFSVRALVVVRADDGHPVARVFTPETGSFDAATYAPDDSSRSPTLSWTLTVRSLERSFGAAMPAEAARPPTLATHEGPLVLSAPPAPRHFYESGWFWGAIGAAAFTGGAVYFATRDSSSPTIHLEMQVPH